MTTPMERNLDLMQFPFLSASPPGVGPAAVPPHAVDTEAGVDEAPASLSPSTAYTRAVARPEVISSDLGAGIEQEPRPLVCSDAFPESAATVYVAEKAPANVHADHMGTAGAEFRVPAGYVLIERELLGRVIKRLWHAEERERKEMFEPPLFLRRAVSRDQNEVR